MRSWLSFVVEGATCVATLDDAPGATALLIVSGGNEVRCGAHRGMARLASVVAASGHPVLRFDRRGVGDSEGSNGGFESSAADIAAAASLLRSSCPGVRRIVAFGNCDAAAALALNHAGAGIDALILANPWTVDAFEAGDNGGDQPSMPPPAAIRARYLGKLGDPGEWLRLVSGKISIGKLLRGLRAAGGGTPSRLGERFSDALSGFAGPITILLARHDMTAQAFLGEWSRPAFAALRERVVLRQCDTASHSFADTGAQNWFDQQLLLALD